MFNILTYKSYINTEANLTNYFQNALSWSKISFIEDVQCVRLRLAEWSLLTLEVHGSDPILGNFLKTVSWNQKDQKRRRGREWPNFQKIFRTFFLFKKLKPFSHFFSTIESVFLSRAVDPAELLIDLGFGGSPASTFSRIPARFFATKSHVRLFFGWMSYYWSFQCTSISWKCIKSWRWDSNSISPCFEANTLPTVPMPRWYKSIKFVG